MVYKQAESEQYFNECFVAYYESVCHYVNRLICDSENAREIAQNSFVKLWEKGDFSKPDFVLRSFLYTLAYHEAMDYLRHRAQISRFRRKILLESACDISWEILDSETDPDLNRQIEHIIDKLPTRRREVFRMSRYENLKNREIAQRLGISTKAVEAHIHHAMTTLRSKF